MLPCDHCPWIAGLPLIGTVYHLLYEQTFGYVE